LTAIVRQSRGGVQGPNYRLWIENEIWFALAYDKRPLTPLELEYVNHYKTRND